MQFGIDPQPGLSVTSQLRGNTVVVHIRGELDYHSTPVLRGEMQQVWTTPGMSAVILDMAEVTFCDSVGLSELIAALRRSEAGGHPLLVSGVQGTLLRVLTITGLRRAFDTYETLDEALAHVPAPIAVADPLPPSDPGSLVPPPDPGSLVPPPDPGSLVPPADPGSLVPPADPRPAG
ncbi:STAS domain-containing protein [Sphaerisporangium fuscum]|uniref:STAS domain-containing protein n=1 Tax=Sphaerisporangium fuscum TaxID=2835868 RepID=UPI001BDCBCE5|nr:STAS domain-containing protein [Sphaerisporangium fuscum]